MRDYGVKGSYSPSSLILNFCEFVLIKDFSDFAISMRFVYNRSLPIKIP